MMGKNSLWNNPLAPTDRPDALSDMLILCEFHDAAADPFALATEMKARQIVEDQNLEEQKGSALTGLAAATDLLKGLAAAPTPQIWGAVALQQIVDLPVVPCWRHDCGFGCDHARL